MFSQLMHAVETLAPPRASVDSAREPSDPIHARAQSLDSTILRSTSPGELADSAISNLRKSLTTQRPGSPKLPPNLAGTRLKSTLEERLRASFVLGDASTGTTPGASGNTTPLPERSVEESIQQPKGPLSPSSTPLPDSPSQLSPHAKTFIPALATSSIPSPESPNTASIPSFSTPELSVVPTEIAEEVSSLSCSSSNPGSDDMEPVDHLSLSKPSSLNSIPTSPANEISGIATAEISSSPKREPSLILTVPENENLDVVGLQKRLELVEQRFSDVSTSFKRLQAEKLAADAVLQELTPLETLKDSDALRDYLQNANQKAQLLQDEINRLNTKMKTQYDRIEELRDTHRLEAKSQSLRIDSLEKQLEETESLLKGSQSNNTAWETEKAEKQSEVESISRDLEKYQKIAKEEEDKRVKAISLLKTVRQKMVKAEKDKEEALREVSGMKEKEKSEREKDLAERAKLTQDIEAVNVEREKAVIGLRAQFDREVTSLKDKHEKDMSAMRAQFELDALTSKSIYQKDLSTKTSQISLLERSQEALTRDKKLFFDQLQLRQGEVESLQSQIESLQIQNSELQYQVRESADRINLLREDLAETQREQNHRSRESNVPSEEVSRLLSDLESKYQGKLSELKLSLSNTEKERNDSEAGWSRKLREKVMEVEELRTILGTTTKLKQEEESAMTQLKDQVARLEKERDASQVQIQSLRAQMQQVVEAEVSTKGHESEYSSKISVLETHLADARSKEAQLRASNKTLREELRKVQSSAALLERQRNPGVGYRTTPAESEISRASSPDSVSPTGSRSPAPQTEEDINLEYLRNVILQFLEHKEMRPNLVKVLGILLRFTPQETRRLIAKV